MAVIEDFILRFKTVGEQGIKNARNAVSGLKDDVQDFANIGGPLQNTLNGIIGRLGGVGIAAGALGTAFVLAGSKALTLAGELMDISGATGIAAGQVASFRTSLIEAGGKAEDAAMILGKLNQSAQEAAAGNEQLQNAFRKLGVFVTDANGQIRPTGEILADITRLFQQGKLGPEQYAAAVDILGKKVNQLELEKLRAVEDANYTKAVQELDKFNDAIDKLVDGVNRKLVIAFGSLAEVINEGGISHGLAMITEEVGRLVGRILNLPTDALAAGWNALVPDFLKIKNAAGLGDPVLAAVDKAEAARKKALEDAKKYNADFEREAKRAKEIADRNKPANLPKTAPDGKGGFGVTPEATVKANEAAQKRIEDAKLEVARRGELQKNTEQLALALQGADKLKAAALKGEADIKAIGINSAKDIEKARLDIFSQERVSEEKKKQEFEEKKKAIEIKALEDVQQVRMRMAEEQRREEERIANIIQQANARIKEEQNLNDVIRRRNEFQNANATATDRERQNAQEIFDLEADRLSKLREIELIKDLPGDVRAQKEAELNKIYEERLVLLKQQQEANYKLTQDFQKGWQRAFNQYREDAFNSFEAAGRIFQKVTSGMEDAIVDFAKTGKFEFRSFLNSVLEEILRSQIRQLLAQTFNIGGARGSSGGGLLGGIGRLLGFANGGIIPTNNPVIVGERGPEIISGAAGRNVTPNSQLGLGTTNVVYNISAVDARSFKEMVAADPSFLYAVTEQGRRSLPASRR